MEIHQWDQLGVQISESKITEELIYLERIWLLQIAKEEEQLIQSLRKETRVDSVQWLINITHYSIET
jgi:hypothetical protein